MRQALKEFLEREGRRAALPVIVTPALPAATSVNASSSGKSAPATWPLESRSRCLSKSGAAGAGLCAQMIGEGRDQRTRARILPGFPDRSANRHDGHADAICDGNDSVRSARDDDNATRFPAQRGHHCQRGGCRFGVDRFAIPELAYVSRPLLRLPCHGTGAASSGGAEAAPRPGRNRFAPDMTCSLQVAGSCAVRHGRLAG